MRRDEESGGFEITDLAPIATDVDPNRWNDAFCGKSHNTTCSEEEWDNVGRDNIRMLLGRALILWGPTALAQPARFDVSSFA
ncbi:MAG: hypothetical protein ACOX6D_06575 [Thermoguttaceae bacterium]